MVLQKTYYDLDDVVSTGLLELHVIQQSVTLLSLLSRNERNQLAILVKSLDWPWPCHGKAMAGPYKQRINGSYKYTQTNSYTNT